MSQDAKAVFRFGGGWSWPCGVVAGGSEAHHLTDRVLGFLGGIHLGMLETGTGSLGGVWCLKFSTASS